MTLLKFDGYTVEVKVRATDQHSANARVNLARAVERAAAEEARAK